MRIVDRLDVQYHQFRTALSVVLIADGHKVNAITNTREDIAVLERTVVQRIFIIPKSAHADDQILSIGKRIGDRPTDAVYGRVDHRRTRLDNREGRRFKAAAQIAGAGHHNRVIARCYGADLVIRSRRPYKEHPVKIPLEGIIGSEGITAA